LGHWGGQHGGADGALLVWPVKLAAAALCKDGRARPDVPDDEHARVSSLIPRGGGRRRRQARYSWGNATGWQVRGVHISDEWPCAGSLSDPFSPPPTTLSHATPATYAPTPPTPPSRYAIRALLRLFFCYNLGRRLVPPYLPHLRILPSHPFPGSRSAYFRRWRARYRSRALLWLLLHR
jgi:hypothetical protein